MGGPDLALFVLLLASFRVFEVPSAVASTFPDCPGPAAEDRPSDPASLVRSPPGGRVGRTSGSGLDRTGADPFDSGGFPGGSRSPGKDFFRRGKGELRDRSGSFCLVPGMEGISIPGVRFVSVAGDGLVHRLLPFGVVGDDRFFPNPFFPPETLRRFDFPDVPADGGGSFRGRAQSFSGGNRNLKMGAGFHGRIRLGILPPGPDGPQLAWAVGLVRFGTVVFQRGALTFCSGYLLFPLVFEKTVNNGIFSFPQTSNSIVNLMKVRSRRPASLN